METEERIVYHILNTVRASQTNNDEVIDEREIRSLMRNYRADILNKYYAKGIIVEEHNYQSLGIVDLVQTGIELTYTLPEIIRLQHNAGIKVTTASAYNVPILSRENYHLAKKNPLTLHNPKGYIEGKTLKIFQGSTSDQFMNQGSGISSVITEISTNKQVYIDALLQFPDDAFGYVWTTSQYPLAQELIANLKRAIIRDLLGVQNVKVDEVANLKNDSIRYHDQGKID